MIATNVWLPKELREWAKAHFKGTRYRSLSGFVNAKLSSVKVTKEIEARKKVGAKKR